MNPINTILLRPTDILFFRDGRPMEGSLAGHGAAWPLPNVTDAAFHAALHRSGLNGHAHDQRQHANRHGTDNRQFGSLVTAGPFPVFAGNTSKPGSTSGAAPASARWFFPRPKDAQETGTVAVTLRPVRSLTQHHEDPWIGSSLPSPLEYAVANTRPPSKESGGEPWISADAFNAYLREAPSPSERRELPHCLHDSAFSDQEATIGIAIDSETGTTGQGDAAGKIYSARYLRLRDDWRMGVFAKTDEKANSSGRLDLIPELISTQQQILVGGQQRLCTATRLDVDSLPLPVGLREMADFHPLPNGRIAVKWVLLSPAIWPEIPSQSEDGRPLTPHCGGWLPNWVRQSDGQVMLRSGRRQPRTYAGKHRRGFADDSQEIAARLVAAIVPKPVPVTGWALANPTAARQGGAKSTHLAVPAGAVYYFEAASAEAAQALAAALNWHGGLGFDHPKALTLQNRRSTLMGEKGFGLGVCGTWKFWGS